MQFFISYKSLLYADIESPFSLIGAFFMIFHVPRLLTDQCSTVLISFDEQSLALLLGFLALILLLFKGSLIHNAGYNHDRNPDK